MSTTYPDIQYPDEAEWSAAHAAAAEAEGWEIAGYWPRNLHGLPQVWRWDLGLTRPSSREEDEDVWEPSALWHRVVKGKKPHHAAARMFYRVRQPDFWDCMVSYVDNFN